jgi:hypothetical protein
MVGSKREEQDALNALVQISEMEQERNYVSSSKVKENSFSLASSLMTKLFV